MNSQNFRQATEELQKGLSQHRSGQLRLAQSHYQRATELMPTNADAWYLLGICELQGGDITAAMQDLQRSIKLKPTFADAHNQLGLALRRLSQHAESVQSFRNAMRLRPQYVEAAYHLGLAYEASGHAAEAESAYRQVLEWNHRHAAAATQLGHLLRLAGRPVEALSFFKLAQQAEPEAALTNGNLAMILLDLDRFEEAVGFASTATALEPGRAQWWCALGVGERLRKNVAVAVDALRRALDLAPRDDYIKAELGLVLLEAGDVKSARILLAQLNPGQHAERFRWALQLSLPSVYLDESEVDSERARFSRGLHSIAEGLDLQTESSRQATLEAASSVTTTLLHYQDRDNTALQFRFGDLINQVMTSVAPEYMSPCPWLPLEHGQRVRIGFVSSHLMHHSISRYYTDLLTSLDGQRFDTRVWYSGVTQDFNTEFIARHVDQFIYTNEPVVTLARTIRAAKLDVLVYLEAGTDPRHQVLAALRIAPVQCVLYGHPVTSGLPNLDYFLSGEALEPVDGDKHYRERLVRLPGIGACPRPPPAPGDGGWIDAYLAPEPLLLCLQNHLKLLPAFDLTLARIVKQTGARIGFFIRNAMVGDRFRSRIEQCFAQQGLDPSRTLVFLPAHAHENYLAAIARTPLVLDSPWFSGGATSLDTLSVGTPVLTWEGAMARGRQTAGMLRVMGVKELIALNEEEYVEKAAQLLSDRQLLAALRQRILDNKPRLFEHGPVIWAFENFVLQTCGVLRQVV